MSGMKIGGGLSGAFSGGKTGGSFDMPGADMSGKGRQDIGPDGPRKGGAQNGDLSNVLNFGSGALGKVGGQEQGVQFGGQGNGESGSLLPNAIKSDVNSQGANGESGDNNILNSVTQLLNAIVQLLQSKGAEGGDKTSNDANSSGADKASGTQDASGSGDIMTQLMDLIKKMLGQSGDNTSTGDAATQPSGNKTAGTQAAEGGGDIMTQLMDLIKKMLGQSSDGSDASPQTGSTGAAPSTSAAQNSGNQEANGLAGKLGGALQMLGLGAILSALQGSGATGAEGGNEAGK